MYTGSAQKNIQKRLSTKKNKTSVKHFGLGN